MGIWVSVLWIKQRLLINGHKISTNKTYIILSFVDIWLFWINIMITLNKLFDFVYQNSTTGSRWVQTKQIKEKKRSRKCLIQIYTQMIYIVLPIESLRNSTFIRRFKSFKRYIQEKKNVSVFQLFFECRVTWWMNVDFKWCFFLSLV